MDENTEIQTEETSVAEHTEQPVEKKEFDAAEVVAFLLRAKAKIDETQSLNEEIEHLKDGIAASNRRISELESELADVFDEFHDSEHFAFISDIIATIDESITSKLVANHKY